VTTTCLVCGEQHEATELDGGVTVVGCPKVPPDRWVLVSKKPLIVRTPVDMVAQRTLSDVGVEQLVIARREQVENVDWSDCGQPWKMP
jgi:hypothetical protein